MIICLLLALTVVQQLAAAPAGSSSDQKPRSQTTNDNVTLLSRMKRNKFVKKFLEKSKAANDMVMELEQNAATNDWPIIAWKENADIFNIGDDGQMESSPFEPAIDKADFNTEEMNVTDFSLKPALSYKSQLVEVRRRIGVYNQVVLVICVLLCMSNFVLVFIRYWLVGLSRLVLRAGLQIDFPSNEGASRQEFIYALAFAIEEDLLESPASHAEQGFAACINDIVVAVESYTMSH